MAILIINATNDFLSIEKEIISKLDSLFKMSFEETWRGNTIWTGKIKEVLSDLGHSLDYISSSNHDGREWLFDLIWFTLNKRNNFNRLVLAMESEWDLSWDQIRYDFDKLLATNATHKLIICQSILSSRDTLLHNFQISINDYQLGIKDERFLISIYNSTKETEFWHYIITRD